MLNFHATFTKSTIEFRLFQFDKPTAEKKNGLHAGQLKSYIQLCLALSEMAKELRTASPKPQQTENPKFAMRTWLMRLGFMGAEFATARDFLTRNLNGGFDWDWLVKSSPQREVFLPRTLTEMRLSDTAESENACPSKAMGGNIAAHVAFVVIVFPASRKVSHKPTQP